jgi:hypothetical protein
MAESEKKPSALGDQNVNLGLGTLILIGLIVSMCSGKGDVESIQKDTTELRKQVAVIDQKLDALLPKGSEATSQSVEAPAPPPVAGAAPAQNP